VWIIWWWLVVAGLAVKKRVLAAVDGEEVEEEQVDSEPDQLFLFRLGKIFLLLLALAVRQEQVRHRPALKAVTAATQHLAPLRLMAAEVAEVV
jgi:hypothetical protein